MSALLFPLGQVVATPGALAQLAQDEIVSFLARHGAGDWGDLCQEDRESNDQALLDGGRIFSAYRNREKEKFWVITEADRSATTILLPEEY